MKHDRDTSVGYNMSHFWSECNLTTDIFANETSTTFVVCLMLADEDVFQLQRLQNTIVSARLVPSVRSDKVRDLFL